MVRDPWATDDLLQETFLKIKNNIDSLNDQAKLKAWAFSIARNQCIDYLRKNASSQERPNPEMPGIGNLTPILLHTQLEQKEMSRCVVEKLNLLSDTQREVIVLSETMEMSCREIADILGISVGNVKVRLHRARKALKTILHKECTFEHDDRNVMICLPKETG